MDFCCQFLRKELCKNKKKVTPLWDGYPKQIDIITIEPIAKLHHVQTNEVKKQCREIEVPIVQNSSNQERKSDLTTIELNSSTPSLENDSPNETSNYSDEQENNNKIGDVNQGLQYLANQIQYFNFQNHSKIEECSMQTFASNSSHYLDITEMSHVDFDEPKDVIRNETKEDTIAKDIKVVDLDDDEMKVDIVNKDYDTSHMKKFLEDSVNNFNNLEDKYLINNESLESSGSEFNSRKSSFASDYITRRSSMDFFLMSPIQRFKDTRSNSLSSNISLNSGKVSSIFAQQKAIDKLLDKREFEATKHSLSSSGAWSSRRSSALSEIEIEGINHLRPYSAVEYPIINIVHTTEEEDYAEENRIPALRQGGRFHRRLSCPGQFLSIKKEARGKHK